LMIASLTSDQIPISSCTSATTKLNLIASTAALQQVLQRRERIPSLRWFYIDGYAGSGHHVSKTRGDLVEGSPLIALNTIPPFHEYHFIDSDTGRAAELR
jgi:three-Cys-motif partner protein